MIHKVERLIAIGKFRAYSASGNVAFAQFTGVFAENGSGKTTLSSVFRSLTEQDSDIINCRRSTNSTQNPVAQIIQRDPGAGDTHYTFNHQNGWLNPFPNIEIFDIHFVNTNVYSGFTFGDNHRTRLHQFVIGAQGVAIKQQIEANKTAKTTLRQTITQLEDAILQAVGNGLGKTDLTNFLRLVPTDATDIHQKIQDAEAVLANARSQDTIRRFPVFQRISELNLLNLDWTAVQRDLNTNLQTISDAALETLFSDHCQDLEDNRLSNSEQWLKKGFDYVVAKNESTGEGEKGTPCPFCKQPLQGLSVMQAYTQIFNQELNALASRVAGYKNQLEAFNLAATIEGIKNQIGQNTERFNNWTSHLNSLNDPNSEDVFQGEDLNTFYVEALQVIVQKSQQPTTAIDATAVTNLVSHAQGTATRITAYNQRVGTSNQAMDTFKGALQTEATAQAEVSRLKQIKKRFNVNTSTQCNQLQAEQVNLRQLEASYTNLVQLEEAAASTFFTDYRDRINYYLGPDKFKTPFLIDSVEHIPPRGRARESKVGYRLTIDGYDVSFDPTQPMSTQSCLSEGDKSTIALAFFLAKLDIDPNLADKVIVFDDPLSSFDKNRRMYTIQLLSDLRTRVKQLIVLSHDEFFIAALEKNIHKRDKKLLRITVDPATDSSRIEELDIALLTEAEYFKHMRALNDFQANPNIAEKDRVLGIIRNVLETALKFRFYNQIPAPGTKPFGELITELNSSGVAFRDSNRTDVISTLNLLNGASLKPHHGDGVPNYSQLGINPAQMSLIELSNLVTDTINLIDHRL